MEQKRKLLFWKIMTTCSSWLNTITTCNWCYSRLLKIWTCSKQWKYALSITNQHLDILAINETKMDSDVPLYLISLKGYTWVAKIRNKSGGGVGFYIRNSINFLIWPDLGLNDIEAITIEINKYKTKPFLVITWYRPPNSPIDLLA